MRRRDFITSFGEFPSVTRAQQRKRPLRRLVALVIAGALLLLPQMADAQKNIKVGLTLPKDRVFKRATEDYLDDRFHESCHKRGIHLSSQTPISAVGGLETKDEKEWQRGGGRLKCRLEMRTSRT